MSEFAFAHPAWLWLLLLLPAIGFLSGRKGGAPAVQFSATDVLRSAGVATRARSGRWSVAWLLAPLTMGILALARPQLANSFSQIETSGIDIMVVLDVSRSMLAEDYVAEDGRRANRIDTVKRITRQFIEQRPADRIGILAFAGRPYLVSPLTLDHGWLLQNLDRLRIGLVEDGTAIGSALASAANRLKDSTSKTRVIVLLSDGGNNAGRVAPATAAEAASALGLKIYTIGAGSQGPAPYPVQDAFGRTMYRTIPADLDEDTLKQLAAIGGGRYFAAKNTRSLQDIFEQIDKLEKSKIEVTQFREYRDFFPWFVGAAVVLLGGQMVLSQSRWRRLP
jgi:Ca-activated chloride channel homolog